MKTTVSDEKTPDEINVWLDIAEEKISELQSLTGKFVPEIC